jgi:phosphatidylserine/phosphatidylglycerophosphate/cardiolipin synthase-like enzyme
MNGMNGNTELYKQTLSYDEKVDPCVCLALPWWVRTMHPTYPPRHGGKIEPLICGERVFERIANDLKHARSSVDIITWGFDPGMVLVRGATAEQGQRYGDLLEEIATRQRDPVTVRLLVWHTSVATQWLMKNIPGYYGTRFPAIGCTENGYYSESHQTYNTNWFSKVRAGKIPNLSFHVRRMVAGIEGPALVDELPLSSAKLKLLSGFLTHHQKMLLIDYERPNSAKGYVMGHNSITDFWDSEKHLFRDPRREWIYKVDPADAMNRAFKEGPQLFPDAPGYAPSEREIEEKERAVQAWLKNNRHVAKPYQDVSIRLKGPILHDLNHNFCQAWQESNRPDASAAEMNPLGSKDLYRKLAMKYGEIDPNFIERRKKIPFEAFTTFGDHSAQLLRTQPMHGEKSIRECYANLTRQMSHYIFIQNQYIQYEPWTEHLKECIQRLRSAGYKKEIYVFIVTSTPEKDGMDLPTYGVARKIGQSETMVQEHAEALEQALREKKPEPITPEEMAERGINVVMGSMWTCADKPPGEKLRADDYEEIYIHAKVAIVDDAAFTIGSANLNLRSMALDSELNVLSEAQDVAYQLRVDLFRQCTGNAGPGPFKDMEETFREWGTIMSDSLKAKNNHHRLRHQILPFHVDRKPGSPVV